MKRRRAQQAPLFPGDEPQAERQPSGAFMPDGSWDPRAWVRGPADALVRELVRRRRTLSVTPAEIAEFVHSGPFPSLLGGRVYVDYWLTLEAWEDWPYARCSTGAAEMILRQGRSTIAHGWSGGNWIPERDIVRTDRSVDLREEFRREAARGNPFAKAYLDRYGEYVDETAS